MKTCTIDGCDKRHQARGLCSTHYNQTHAPGRHRKIEVACTQCGALLLKQKSGKRKPFCDYTCRDLYSMEHKIGAWGQEPKAKPEPKSRRDLRSPIRRAYEDGDGAGLIDAVRADCEVRPNGCWEWQRTYHYSGYAKVIIGKKWHQVHRLTLEAHLGKPLGKQAAHHACANSFCVNPEHLQPVTTRDNTAEMMARTYMESRIRDLESALALHDPNHPLLLEVGVVGAA